MDDAGEGPGTALLGATLVTSGVSVAFALNQNRGEVVGGPIHWSKAAWLNVTILNFIVLPGVWWLRSDSSPAMRRLMRTLSLQFVVRGLVELPMIYRFHNWKCGYGISHDVGVFAIMGAQLIRDRDHFDRSRDGLPLAHASLAMVMLLVEAGFAKMFRQIQDPATGIYFADDSPRFRRVIRITKAVIFVVYPALAIILWRARAGTKAR